MGRVDPDTGILNTTTTVAILFLSCAYQPWVDMVSKVVKYSQLHVAHLNTCIQLIFTKLSAKLLNHKQEACMYAYLYHKTEIKLLDR